MKWREKLSLWLPVLVWAGIIFGFSSLEINKETEFSWIDFIIKKTAHVTEYAILFFLTWRAMSNRGEKKKPKILVTAFVLGLIYALSDEWHQTFVPGREGTLRDVGFDTIGMLLSWAQVRKWL